VTYPGIEVTGKLFNEMYNWLGFSQDKLNDVVLTPTYISTLLVRLARVNKNSYVWDFATGSAGLLIAAMNEMLEDAKSIKSPDKRIQKEVEIKAQQLLGIEILPEIYMLAILNMILMGDGSSNILNEDSLKDFKNKDDFPADAFILNPPYSASGNGMVFVQKALDMMNKVCTTKANPFNVFTVVFFRHWFTWYRYRSTTMTFQCSDGGNNNGTVRLEAGVTAFEVPEFFKTDISTKAGLGNVVVGKFQRYPVGNNRRLANGDIGKRTCMNHNRLAFQGLHHVRVNRINHPGGHGTVHFKISGGDRSILLVIGYNHLTDPLAHIFQVIGNGENSHDL